MSGSARAFALALRLGLGAVVLAGCASSDPDEKAPSDVSGVTGLPGGPAPTVGTGAPGVAQPPGTSPTPTTSAPTMGAAGGAAEPPASGGEPPASDEPPAGGMMMPPPTMTVPTPRSGETCLAAGNGKYTEKGPYAVGTMEIDLGMIASGQSTGKFTIYYPTPLEADCLHPVVAWGNGTGVMGSGVYTFFNENAASWGMVVAESQENNTGSGAFHKAGLDWLLAQNEDSSSMFYKKLSTRAGVSGHSQGGFGASVGSSHANVETAVVVGASMNASTKVSVLVLTGTEDIVRNPGSLSARAGGPMFVAVWEGGDHFATETLAGYIARDAGSLQMQRLYAAWFRCFLADDSVACGMFEGGTPSGCGICQDQGWNLLDSANL